MIRRSLIAVAALAALTLAAGCETPLQKLYAAEKIQTGAQDLWTGALENGRVKDRFSIQLGGDTLRASGNVIRKGYRASTQPAVLDDEGNPVGTLADWANDAKELAIKTAASIARLLAEAAARQHQPVKP